MSLAYGKGSSGKCPHCQHVVFFDSPVTVIEKTNYSSYLWTESGGDGVYVYSSQCPNCKKPIVVARIKTGDKEKSRLVHPFNIVRTVPPEVPTDIQDDFLEAAAVLPVSEKASSALSRRCLQTLLIKNGAREGDTLSSQIDTVLPQLPSYLAENLDAIRNVGNFAAHPMKDKSTGEIVDVEPEEATWNLDVLEQLFDFYYVQPKKAEEKRKKLDAKLKSIGKPALKKP